MPLPERKKLVLCMNLESLRTHAQSILLKQPMNGATYEDAAKIIALTRIIQAQALAMEKRLYLYKETIEGLGFKRIRK